MQNQKCSPAKKSSLSLIMLQDMHSCSNSASYRDIYVNKKEHNITTYNSGDEIVTTLVSYMELEVH